MEEDEDRVSITCNGETHQFVIEDIDPNFLQTTFNLPESPTTLFSVSSLKRISGFVKNLVILCLTFIYIT